MRSLFNRLSLVSGLVLLSGMAALAATKPNIVLVMTDDQGWGQMGFYNHPVLKTPSLDAMAANGLRLNRFYAGAPNCSPTRATVMTGRTNDRTGVENHGFPLRLQEKALPRAMKKAGYATGHFGKWHLNGYTGPGAPILKDDARSPGGFGFDEWLSVSNFFDRDPLLSRKGKFEDYKGDSSEIVVDEALKFIRKQVDGKKPFFVVIWFGTPHSPFMSIEEDMKAFDGLDGESRKHYGEMVAMDRSIGALRKGLRAMEVHDDTLLWFNSDNGGLPRIKPETVGGLRGFKNSVYEGGLRVPCVIEWPSTIKAGRVSNYPAGTFDIFPTIVDVLGLPSDTLLQPVDGVSIKPLFSKDLVRRTKPMGFRHTNRAAFLDNNLKLVSLDVKGGKYAIYDLAKDPDEKTDIQEQRPGLAKRMIQQFKEWNASVDASYAGKDYPEGRVSPDHPPRKNWPETEEYAPYIEGWKDRPEFKRYLNKKK